MISEQAEEDFEDLTGLAGWMYTDLLLALMVVFLATISFIPSLEINASANTNKGKDSYNYSKFLDKKFEATYSFNEVEKLISDTNSFKQNNQMGQDIVIGSIQIIGGYNPNTEKSGEGIQRSLRFVTNIQEIDQVFLKYASTILDTSSKQNSDSVKIIASFIAQSDINKFS